jgi:hypothetical protein
MFQSKLVAMRGRAETIIALSGLTDSKSVSFGRCLGDLDVFHGAGFTRALASRAGAAWDEPTHVCNAQLTSFTAPAPI